MQYTHGLSQISILKQCSGLILIEARLAGTILYKKGTLMYAMRQRFAGLPLISHVVRAALSPKQRAGASARTAATRHELTSRAESAGRFVVVLSQGRAGSTLILRMLNACPGVRICGENNRAFDHLKHFVECYRGARKNHTSDFYKLAWMLPCEETVVLSRLRELAVGLYNPDGAHSMFGFKEIRYGQNGDLESDLAFLRQLFPGLRVIFNVRRTEDCVKSLWWAADPEGSAKTLETMRASFREHYDRHREDCYWMPFEELRRGSAVLQGMFDFLDTPMTPLAAAELDVRMRE